MKRQKVWCLLATGAVLLMSACGGGDIGSGVAPVTSGPTNSAPTTSAPMKGPSPTARVSPTGIEGTGFKMRGLVAATDGTLAIVNGVEWNIATAALDRDGLSIGAADVNIGDVVSISGSVSAGAGEAQTLTETTIALGPIERVFINPSSAQGSQAGQIFVLGQTIEVQIDTRFPGDLPDGLASLHVGDVVRVSGQSLSNGLVVATRIDLAGPPSPHLVTGIVRLLATQSGQFQITDLVVNYAGAVLKDFPGGALGTGDRVQVIGQADSSGTFLARQISYLQKKLPGSPGTPAQICGYITSFDSAEHFDVDGQPVITTAQTGISPTAVYLMLDSEVCATGTLDANKALVASSVQVATWDYTRGSMVQGTLEAIDPEESAVTVAGVRVPVQPGVVIQDLQSDPVARPRIAMSDLRAGDYVRVFVDGVPWTYRLAPDGTNRIERRPPSAVTFIQGYPTFQRNRAGSMTFDVWNLKIGIDARTTFTGQIDCVAPCNIEAYLLELQQLELLSAGDWIAAEGRYVGSHRIVADTIDLEIY